MPNVWKKKLGAVNTSTVWSWKTVNSSAWGTATNFNLVKALPLPPIPYHFGFL